MWKCTSMESGEQFVVGVGTLWTAKLFVKQTYSDTSQHNFGAGTGPSLLGDLRCTGSEANLLQCPHGGLGLSCPHS